MTPERPSARIEVLAPGTDWPEVGAGDRLADLFAAEDLADGDVVVVTSKVVSKAEGRAAVADRTTLVERDTVHVVARRGSTVIARTAHGLTLAAAGVDASNVAPGTALSLPVDPDASARGLRCDLLDRLGVNVAVVVSDTAGRAWRQGQTDIAIGCAGLGPIVSLAGTVDPYGNPLAVTAAAVADELASAADLVKGKTSGRPVAVIRGYDAAVLPAGEHGPGAAALLRGGDDDLFGLGARDAVRAVVARDPSTPAGIPRLAEVDIDPFEPLHAQAGNPDVEVSVRRDAAADPARWSLLVTVPADASDEVLLAAGRVLERIDVLAAGHRLVREEVTESSRSRPGRRTVDESHWVVA